jgi:hypothetical protein
VAVEPGDIAPPPGESKDAHRILVVANETVGGRVLLDEIAERARDRNAQVLVVAPALVESRLKHALGDVDEAVEQARERLNRSVERIRSAGVEAEGTVGDADPNLAIVDALRTFPADEVIISTHPKDRSTWLEKDVVERAREEIAQPITHVVVDLEAESESEKATRVARLPRRTRRRRADEQEETDYLPPMPLRDRITLLVGIPGTIVLGILAVTCPDDGSFSGGCAVRGAIALAAFMITLWHSVALILMGSVRYRGFWSAAAADMVLWGVPPAIVVSLLLG